MDSDLVKRLGWQKEMLTHSVIDLVMLMDSHSDSQKEMHWHLDFDWVTRKGLRLVKHLAMRSVMRLVTLTQPLPVPVEDLP